MFAILSIEKLLILSLFGGFRDPDFAVLDPLLWFFPVFYFSSIFT